MTEMPAPIFTFRDTNGREEVLPINHPETGFRRFSDFVEGAAAQEYSVENTETGERFTIEPGRCLMTRFSGPGSSITEYLIYEGLGLVGRARGFFKGGYIGIDYLSDQFDPWLRDLAELEFSPEKRGAARARAIIAAGEALQTIVQRWADWEHEVDPSDQYYVFLGGHDINRSRVERAELLGLIEYLELEQVQPQDGGSAGEIWVRFDPRVNSESENQVGWSPDSPPDDDKKSVLRDDAGNERTAKFFALVEGCPPGTPFNQSVLDLGELVVMSGNLEACDPFVQLGNGFVVKVQPGRYPVRVTLADVSGKQDGSHIREAYLSVVLGDGEVAEVKMLTPEDAVPVEGAGFYGVPVDAGTVGFVDADAVAQYTPEDYEEVFDNDTDTSWFSLMDSPDHLRAGCANISLPDAERGENVVLGHSGWGDGFYPVLGTYGADGQLLGVHIDLLVAGTVDEDDQNEDEGDD